MNLRRAFFIVGSSCKNQNFDFVKGDHDTTEKRYKICRCMSSMILYAFLTCLICLTQSAPSVTFAFYRRREAKEDTERVQENHLRYLSKAVLLKTPEKTCSALNIQCIRGKN